MLLLWRVNNNLFIILLNLIKFLENQSNNLLGSRLVWERHDIVTLGGIMVWAGYIVI